MSTVGQRGAQDNDKNCTERNERSLQFAILTVYCEAEQDRAKMKGLLFTIVVRLEYTETSNLKDCISVLQVLYQLYNVY